MKKSIISLLIAASLSLTACESKEAKEAVQAASAVGSSVTTSEAMASETPEMAPEDLGYGDPEKTGQQLDEKFNNGRYEPWCWSRCRRSYLSCRHS